MSTSSEAPPRIGGVRSSVLRGSDAAGARPARMDAELRSSPFAAHHTMDARLTDPHLEQVVAAARRQAVAQGTAEGHRAGYAAGLAAAAAEAQLAAEQAAQLAADREALRDAQLAEVVTLLTSAAEAFRRREATSLSDIEGAVTELALGIARAVLDRELTLSENPVREAVARALALAPEGSPAVVRLHPDDVDGLGEIDRLGAGRTLTVVADRTVERRGCVVEGAGRQVDAQIGPALARVAAALQDQSA